MFEWANASSLGRFCSKVTCSAKVNLSQNVLFLTEFCQDMSLLSEITWNCCNIFSPLLVCRISIALCRRTILVKKCWMLWDKTEASEKLACSCLESSISGSRPWLEPPDHWSRDRQTTTSPIYIAQVYECQNLAVTHYMLYLVYM